MAWSPLIGGVLLVVSLAFDGGARLRVRQPTCAVQGVWVMESSAVDGKPEHLDTYRSQKIVTPTHFAFVSNENGAPSSYGGGTYKVSGGTYTEHLEYFYKSDYLNLDLSASCRVAGSKWYHSFQWPVIEKGKETRRIKIDEVWRRVG